MDINKERNIPKRLQTTEHLADEVWHLANNLSIGRWRFRDMQQVESMRGVIETLGEELERLDFEIEPVFNQVKLSFVASKLYIVTKRGDPGVPMYKLTSITSQDIEQDEIPADVLADILEDASHEGHALNDEDGFLGLEPQELLQASELQRNQEVTYMIDYEGEFSDYTLRYFYSIDGVSVHEMEYSHSGREVLWNPIRLADGTVNESKPAVLLSLTNSTIEADVKNIDSSLERFLIERDVNDLAEFAELPNEEHVRRALGMVSMLSSGVIDLRKRNRKR